MAIKIPKRHFGYDTLFSEKNSATLQVDADLGGDMDKGKSNSGNVFTLGSITVNWMSKFQKFLSLSILESEYVAIYKVSKVIICLKNFLKEIGKKQNSSVFSMTIRVLFVLQRIRYCIQGQSTFS